MEAEAKVYEEKNKYEAIMVIAKESRRINNRLRGQNVDFKVTTLAMERYLNNRVKWEYWDPASEEEVGRSAVETPGAAAPSVLSSAIETTASEGVAAPVDVDEAPPEEVQVKPSDDKE